MIELDTKVLVRFEPRDSLAAHRASDVRALQDEAKRVHGAPAVGGVEERSGLGVAAA